MMNPVFRSVPTRLTIGNRSITHSVTRPLTGTRTFNVGPDQEFDEPDTVPWATLLAGDVVNIFHRDRPYLWKFGLRGQGTAAQPIIVNGVTDAAGQRPQFVFDGARTCGGCNPGDASDIFDPADPEDGEALGGIVIKAGENDPYGAYKPCHIHIQHLECCSAKDGATFTGLSGLVIPFHRAAGIYVHLGTDILIENCLIHDNGNGVFTMAREDTLAHVCERVTLRNNYIHGNGQADSDQTHNCYIQCANPLIEGNYLGPLRANARGASYKSRASGEVFRYNHVVAGAIALDLVHGEGQNHGLVLLPDYGTDYVYGNVIVNDLELMTGGSSEPIHYGGDNLGEDTDSGPLVEPATPYRRHLHFWNNTVIQRASLDKASHLCVFGLSQVVTTVDAWDNIFGFEGDSHFSWLEYTGTLNLRGTNLVHSATGSEVADIRRDGSNTDRHAVNRLGTLSLLDPAFRASGSGDFRLTAVSPAIDAASGLPADLADGLPASIDELAFQAGINTNGMTLRRTQGAGTDLGALEFAGDEIPSDVPGITVAPSSLTTTEQGTSVDFTVVLDSAPTDTVSLTFSSSNLAEGELSRSSLTFTPENWNQPQGVLVSGMDDALPDGDVAYRIEFDPSVSADDRYDGLTVPPLEVVNRDDDSPAPPSVAYIAYTTRDQHDQHDQRVWRVRAEPDAVPEDISAALDRLRPHQDTRLNLSPNGKWMILRSDRFDRETFDWPCLVLLPSGLTAYEVLRTRSDSLIHTGEWAAVDNEGRQVVFSADGGATGHARDLWLIRKNGDRWDEPILLTGLSPYSYNVYPSLSNEGDKIVFEAGDEAEDRHSACEVRLDGSGFRIVLEATGDVTAVHKPDYGPDDQTIVCEVVSSGRECIARVDPGQVGYTIINEAFDNDSSPCVLPDGRIASLWCDRQDSTVLRELKVMAADGSSDFIVMKNVEVSVDGLGCGAG